MMSKFLWDYFIDHEISPSSVYDYGASLSAEFGNGFAKSREFQLLIRRANLHHGPTLPDNKVFAVKPVLDFFEQNFPRNDDLSEKDLLTKCIVLLGLVLGARPSDLQRTKVPAVPVVELFMLTKSSFLTQAFARGRFTYRSVKLDRYPENEALCPVRAIEAYLSKIADKRRSDENLFVFLDKSGKALGSQSIARYMKEGIALAGVQNCSARHLRRSAATELSKKLPVEQVVAFGNWAGSEVLRRHYNKSRLDYSMILSELHS